MIKRIRYKGYKIEIISEITALVVCKNCKGNYIPFFSEESCKCTIDNLISGKTNEETYSLWDKKQRKKAIKEGL